MTADSKMVYDSIIKARLLPPFWNKALHSKSYLIPDSMLRAAVAGLALHVNDTRWKIKMDRCGSHASQGT